MEDIISQTIDKLNSYIQSSGKFKFIGTYDAQMINEINNTEKYSNNNCVHLYLFINNDILELYSYKNSKQINKFKIDKNNPLTEKKIKILETDIFECSICYSNTNNGIICEWCGSFLCVSCNLSNCFYNSVVCITSEFTKILYVKCPYCRHENTQNLPELINNIITEYNDTCTDNEINIELYDNKIIPKLINLTFNNGKYIFSANT